MCGENPIYDKAIEILKNHKVKKTRNRPNVSGVEKKVQWGKDKGTNKWTRVGYLASTENYGLVKKRFPNNGNINERIDNKNPLPSNNNQKNPIVYELLKELIEKINPDFKYNTITLNHNFKCEPHYDKLNKSPSLIVAFGDYTGGELMIEGCGFDINRKPLIMNGGIAKHWTADFTGDRWSVVYYEI
jgi:hypothetical protein|tara:strand:- start:355 stop:915 length:561 start_codon:yes stop_codon:yes gene_type:complete